jgi:putative membrane protein
MSHPYRAYEAQEEEMILRDYLAIDRTIMSNESTFLANIRTTLTFVVAGVTLIKFFNSLPFQVLGWVLMAIGGWLLLHGYNKYQADDKVLKKMAGREEEGSSQGAWEMIKRAL